MSASPIHSVEKFQRRLTTNDALCVHYAHCLLSTPSMPLKFVYCTRCCDIFYRRTEHFRKHGGRVPHACNLTYCGRCLLSGGEFLRLSTDSQAVASLHMECPPVPELTQMGEAYLIRLTQLASAIAAPNISPSTAPDAAFPAAPSTAHDVPAAPSTPRNAPAAPSTTPATSSRTKRHPRELGKMRFIILFFIASISMLALLCFLSFSLPL